MTPDEFKELNPDLHTEIMALNARLATVGANLSVTVPGNQPVEPMPAPVPNLLDVQAPPGVVAQSQLTGSLRDLITGLGFVLVAFGVPKPQWLVQALTPEGMVALGMIVVALRRVWSYRIAIGAAVLDAREKIVALHLRNVKPDGTPTTVADVKRITAQRVQVAKAQAARKEGLQ